MSLPLTANHQCQSAIKFGAYEGSKKAFAHLEGHGDPKNLNGLSQFLAAGIGGIISQQVAPTTKLSDPPLTTTPDSSSTHSTP